MAALGIDAAVVKEQYREPANLSARIALHARFSTATRTFHDWLFDHLDLPGDARILEVGCGTGALWRTVHARVPARWRLALSDYSLGMLAETRALCAALGLNARFVQSDAQAIAFPGEAFDAVIANHMLYHLPDLPRALSEIGRILKPSGKLFAATNGVNHMRELQAFGDAYGLVTSHIAALSFRLDNGHDLLAPHFASVARDDFADVLHVTEVEPLVAYIKSFRVPDGPDTTEREQRLRALAAGRIARDGVIRITKEVGLFVARKAIRG